MVAEDFGPGREPVGELVGSVAGGTGRSRVALSGELDLATAEELVEVLERLRARGERRVVLDLADLEFCDVCGLDAILRAQRRLSAEGGGLTVTGAPPSFDG